MNLERENRRQKIGFFGYFPYKLFMVPIDFLYFLLFGVKFDGESESGVHFFHINGVKGRKCTKTDLHVFTFIITFLNRIMK